MEGAGGLMIEDFDTDPNQNNRPLKSIHSLILSEVLFNCRTNGRRARLFWLDYKGVAIPYKTMTYKDGGYMMNTFVTHPWIVRDADTGDEMLLNGQRVFYPQAWSEEMPLTYVNIDIPVYSLKTRSLQEVRKLCDPEEFEHLELPNDLKHDLHIRTDPLLNILLDLGEEDTQDG